MIELSKEATAYCDTLDIADQSIYKSIWEREFGELIVRECAELSVNSQYTNTKSEYYEGFNEALIYAGNKIKEHFGVEQ